MQVLLETKKNKKTKKQVDVNGVSEEPLYDYLKTKTNSGHVLWNFSKFLVVAGVPIKKYTHTVSSEKMKNEIFFALNALKEYKSKKENIADKAPIFF